MRQLVTRLLVLLVTVALARPACAQQPSSTETSAQPSEEKARSPWLILPVFSSSPKLGTSGGGMGAYMHKFDAKSRVSLFGVSYQYTSTQSQIAGVFARTSFGADHHRIVVVGAFGNINNDYDNYLGTGVPLKTNDNLRAIVARYLFRAKGDWFIGPQGTAANYQVFGATAEDDLVLETLGVRGFKSAALGAVVMHDSRDNEDMATRGWFLNMNHLAYREALGGEASYDAYRADTRAFWQHGGRHVLAMRQNNWWTVDAPVAAEATVILRGYKFGQYLSPYMSSLEVEERLSFSKRWGATLFAGVAGLYGEAPATTEHSIYPDVGAGVHYVLKPAQRMLVNLEYAQGLGGSRGVYVKLGYAW